MIVLLEVLLLKKDSTAVETLLELSNKAGLNLTEENIEDAYFLKNKEGNGKKAIVVKFINKKSKDKVMMSKAKLREAKATKHIFVNDYLSKETLNLLNYAKSLKSIAYFSTYTSGTRVFVRKNQISKPKLIRSEDEVDKILEEAATFKAKRRAENRPNVNVDDSDGDDGNGVTV